MRTQYSTTSSTNALTRSGNLPGSSLCRIKASVASLSRAGSRSACSAVGRSSACRIHVASMRTCAVGSPAESLSSASICSVCAEKDSIVDGNSTLSMTTCGSSGSSASLEVLPILRSSSITVSSSGPSSDIACRPQRRGSGLRGASRRAAPWRLGTCLELDEGQDSPILAWLA